MTDTVPPSAARFAAVDVPALRRELADWYGGPQGALYYYNAIIVGRQLIRPPGQPQRRRRPDHPDLNAVPGAQAYNHGGPAPATGSSS